MMVMMMMMMIDPWSRLKSQRGPSDNVLFEFIDPAGRLLGGV